MQKANCKEKSDVLEECPLSFYHSDLIQISRYEDEIIDQQSADPRSTEVTTHMPQRLRTYPRHPTPVPPIAPPENMAELSVLRAVRLPRRSTDD